MITPEEEARLRSLYIDWKSNDPLWLDVARLIEVSVIAHTKKQEPPELKKRVTLMMNWMPGEVFREIAENWKESPTAMRQLVARLCAELAGQRQGERELETDQTRDMKARARKAAEDILSECSFDPVKNRPRLAHEVLGRGSRRSR